MTKRITTLVAAVLMAIAMMAGPALANPTTVSDNASGNACFGQWRASSVQDLTEQGYVVGRDFFSERKGDNASMNAHHRDVDCAD